MNKKEKILLYIILALAFVLRIGGIFHGYPLIVFSDEIATLLASLKMMGSFSLRASEAVGYYYPALLSYIYLPFLSAFIICGKWLGLFLNIAQIKESVFFNLGLYAIVARCITVFFGVSTVFLVYKITNKLFNSVSAGLLSAFLLAISFFHVGTSHLANTWVPQTFFYLLVLYWAINFLKKESISFWDYIWGGLLISAAFGINFVGIISYYWLLLVHFLKHKNKKIKNIFLLNNYFWLVNIIIVAGIFFIYWLNPHGLDNYLNRIIVASPKSDYASYQIFDLNTLYSLFFYIKNLFLIEPIFFFLSLCGAIVLWKKERQAFFLLFVGAIVYLIALAPMTGLLIRYALPIFPLLVIITGYLIYIIFERGLKKISLFVVIVVSIYTLTFSLLFNLRLMRPNTLTLARSWIIQNIPTTALVKNYDLADDFQLIESKNSINFIKDNFPSLLSTKRKYLLSLDDNGYPQPNFNIYNYRSSVGDLREFDYVIIGDTEQSNTRTRSIVLQNDYILIKQFYPVDKSDNGIWPGYYEIGAPFNRSMFKPFSLFKHYNSGPYIEIYKLRSAK